MGTRVYQYSLGAAAATAELITFVELASAGDPLAKSRLVYPGSPPAFNPITYFVNPDKRGGFDNDQLILPPSRTAVKTLDDHVVISFENTVVDRFVEERWTVDRGKLSMPTSFYRELRNYNENTPDPETLGFIQWFPENQSSLGWNVVFISLNAGTDPEMPMVGPEYRPEGGGGNVGGEIIAGPDGDLAAECDSAGWQRDELVLRMLLVSQVP